MVVAPSCELQRLVSGRNAPFAQQSNKLDSHCFSSSLMQKIRNNKVKINVLERGSCIEWGKALSENRRRLGMADDFYCRAQCSTPQEAQSKTKPIYCISVIAQKIEIFLLQRLNNVSNDSYFERMQVQFLHQTT